LKNQSQGRSNSIEREKEKESESVCVREARYSLGVTNLVFPQQMSAEFLGGGEQVMHPAGLLDAEGDNGRLQ